MYFVSKKIEVAGAHHLTLDYDSLEGVHHGHNWIITIYCRAQQLNHNGMVVDLAGIKQRIISHLDHKNINEVVDFNPTAENIARWVVDSIKECYKCSVQERDGNLATYVMDDKYSNGNGTYNKKHQNFAFRSQQRAD